MIKLYGRVAGKKTQFEFEDPLSCYATLERMRDLIDVVEREGCPENCSLCIWAKLDKGVIY